MARSGELDGIGDLNTVVSSVFLEQVQGLEVILGLGIPELVFQGSWKLSSCCLVLHHVEYLAHVALTPLYWTPTFPHFPIALGVIHRQITVEPHLGDSFLVEAYHILVRLDGTVK